MPEPLSSDRLAAIRERHAAATDGPWWFDESADTWRLHGVAFRVPPQADGAIPEQIVNKQILKAPKHGTPYAEYWPGDADAAFIAGAWEDVRVLLADRDQLTEVAYTQARMISEITSACMAAESERDRLKAANATLQETAAERLAELADIERSYRKVGNKAAAARADFAAGEIRSLFGIEWRPGGGEPRG